MLAGRASDRKSSTFGCIRAGDRMSIAVVEIVASRTACSIADRRETELLDWRKDRGRTANRVTAHLHQSKRQEELCSRQQSGKQSGKQSGS